MTAPAIEPAPNVTPLSAVSTDSLEKLLEKLGMTLNWVDSGHEIPGSFWGDSEAGLIGNGLFARADTPVHSLLHESCHFACMDDERKSKLHTDAGGDYAEEDAVCYLQIVLAEQIDGYSSEQCMQDMDAWGYTFRLGSAKAWFQDDAEDARQWLKTHDLMPQLLN